jgi:hypothetical protein
MTEWLPTFNPSFRNDLLTLLPQKSGKISEKLAISMTFC